MTLFPDDCAGFYIANPDDGSYNLKHALAGILLRYKMKALNLSEL
jgi:hypothetical protein